MEMEFRPMPVQEIFLLMNFKYFDPIFIIPFSLVVTA
jgi:hypothetical protein